ncbi:MAG: TonB-dependent receptor [Casimicrobiaceae bacterium]
MRWQLFAAASIAAWSCLASPAHASETVRLPPVDVIGVAPLPGLDLPWDEVPANVQQFGAPTLPRTPGATPAEQLGRDAASVSTGSATGNALQADLAYRGFTASPLLGTPQGLSVFLDGVRVNEVFGDVVNWDLIPASALASIALVPGSNPVFGLNTLGGAVTLTTRDGEAFPGTRVAVQGGSFGRRGAIAEHGGAAGPVDWYVTADGMEESGWREHSDSRLGRGFGKLRYHDPVDAAEIGVQLADTRLAGTQALPVSMLSAPREAYTWPDTTRNRLAAVTARGRHALAPDSTLSALVYWRSLRTDALNSNVNAGVDDDAPAASNVRSRAANRAWGASLQWTAVRAGPLGLHRLAAGVAADAGTTDFDQSSTPADITGSREIVDAAPAIGGASARADVRQAGFYALDSVAIGERTTFLVSARYQLAHIAVRDRSGVAPELDGTHRFARLNPALGATYRLHPGTSLYANWSRGMRVPTAMELTCADPGAPCSLPNIFVADPPLQAVVATTAEAGIRYRARHRTAALAIYRTRLADDIQFIATAAGSGSAGYFANVGRTERTGAELTATTSVGALAFDVRYGYTRAVYLSDFASHSPANLRAAPDGTILVTAGNRIPAIPTQVVKARVEWNVDPRLALGAILVGVGRQYARGNENNTDPAGHVPGYATVDLDLRWQPAPRWMLEARVSNLLDRRYGSFGTLGTHLFRGEGGTYAPALAQPELFLVPATPRAATLLLRYSWDAT